MRYIPIVVLSCVLVACATTDSGHKEQTGAIVGGVLGGLLGHEVGDGSGRTAATIIGTLAGAAIGSAIGRGLDDVDRMQMGSSLESSPTGRPTRWRNPDSRRDYKFWPTHTEKTADGPCREFTLEAVIGGETEQIFGKACRQADGNWKVVDA